MGVFVANSSERTIPLFVPENATIGLNVPLTPSRRGSCSTRTTHPYFMGKFNELLDDLGIGNTISNPLDFLTKGECVEQCLNREVLMETVELSVSCGKRGHKKTWINREHVNGCGRCMPCIYRRAALHKLELDNEVYGRNISNGEVSLDNDKRLADDFRACISFLHRNYTTNQIATILLANGTIDVHDLEAYSQVVDRAMDEVRQLLRDKGSLQIRQRAGI